MKIEPELRLVERARAGELLALEELLRQIQGPLYNLALRMLGKREDAQDATQEILLKVTTHLASWRGESAFSTWTYSIASHHLLNHRMRSPGRAEISFEELTARLDQGLASAQKSVHDETAISPEDRLEARRTALACTQAMLMCLEAPGRLAYVLDVIFGLESPEAAAVQGIAPAAHRQRLSRARLAVHGFMKQRCGLVNATAPCRCVRQIPAKRAAAARGLPAAGLVVTDEELETVADGLRELLVMSDAAAVMRSAPAYAAPHAMLQGIRLVVANSAMLRQ